PARYAGRAERGRRRYAICTPFREVNAVLHRKGDAMRHQQTLCRPAILLLAAPLALACPGGEEEPAYRGRPLRVWLEQLRGGDVKDRQEAAVALEGSIGPEGKAAVPVLIRALEDKDRVVQSRAIGALGKIGPPAGAAAPALIAIYKDKNKDF